MNGMKVPELNWEYRGHGLHLAERSPDAHMVGGKSPFTAAWLRRNPITFDFVFRSADLTSPKVYTDHNPAAIEYQFSYRTAWCNPIRSVRSMRVH